MLWINRSVVLFLFLTINISFASEEISKVSVYVNSFIGTGGEGHTYPGAVRPWGMVSVNPHTNYTSPLGYLFKEPVASAGYHYGEKSIKGFGQTHLSGVGCPDLGAPVVFVKTGKKKFKNIESKYSKEFSSPGFYSVVLDDFLTQVELTSTKRVGVHRFTFPKGEMSYIFINASKNLSWSKDAGEVKFDSETELSGWSQTGKFCNKDKFRKVYFSARINISPKEYETFDGKKGGYWAFENGGAVELFIGVSYTSMENAKANLESETSHKVFDEIQREAGDEWNQTLGRIKVNGATTKDKTLFYTSLYRSLIHPNVVSDVNGDYPLYERDGIGNDPLNERYGVFSLWDTYRNVHSLLSLVYPKQQQAMLLSLEAMTMEAGHAPQWELLGNEVNMMVGDPALSIFAEGVAKGFYFKNLEKLYSILYKGATTDSNEGRRPGNLLYRKVGYIPHKTSKVWGAVSTTLEYSYHDWSLAKIAKALGKEEDEKILLGQSSGWQKLFDPLTFTLRPKDKKGIWLKSFDPKATKGEHILKEGGPGYVEGSAYQYAFMVPHGIKELIKLHGGEEKFNKHLDDIFKNNQFTLWNEPDMAYPYLFSYTENGLATTQRHIKNIREKYFDNNPFGLPGNEDVGTLSTWYVFSSLGIYPANPASGEYRLGIPLFDEIEIALGRGRFLKINKSSALMDQVLFDELPLKGAGINHADIINGGILEFGI